MSVRGFRSPGDTPGSARALIALAAPIGGVSLANMAMSMTDTIMIGWLGHQSLAAGAVYGDLQSIVFFMLSGVLLPLGPMVSQAIGERREGRVRRIARNGFAVALILVVPSLLLVSNLDLLLSSIGVEDDIVALGKGYGRTMAITASAMLFVAFWRGIYTACGRPNIFFLAVVALIPANALLNGLFMFGAGPIPALGLIGAGVSSALVAVLLAAALTLFALLDHRLGRYRLFRRFWRVEIGGLLEIFQLGGPVGLSQLVEYGLFLMSTVVISLFGSEMLAAHVITLRMAGLSYIVPVGLSQASSIQVAYAIGREDPWLLRRTIASTVTVGLSAGLFLCVVVLALKDFIPGLFLGDNAVASHAIGATAASLLVLLAWVNLATGPGAMSAGILRGMRDTRAPMLLTGLGHWVAGGTVGLSLGFGLGLEAQGIWMGILTGVTATALLMSRRLRGMLVQRDAQWVKFHATATVGSNPRAARWYR